MRTLTKFKFLYFYFIFISFFGCETQAKEVWQQSQRSTNAKNKDVNIKALNSAFVGLAKRFSPSVVFIQTKTNIPTPNFGLGRGGAEEELFRFFFGNPFGGPKSRQPKKRQSQSLGSGFIINESGLIVTNAHVVRQHRRNVDEIKIKFIGDPQNFEGHEAELLGADDETEVAVLKLKKKIRGLKPIPLGNSSDVRVGEWVVAIGNPYGHTHSVTKGIVSALGRNIDPNLRSDFIQTDASINPGNSGGPLINLYGEVIGINTAIDARAQGIGFAIPIDVAKGIIRQIVKGGKVVRGWIGVALGELSPKLAESLGLDKKTQGALIADVMTGQPAKKAGIKTYDVIVEFNNQKIRNARELMIAVGRVNVGETVPFKVLRKSREKRGKIKIARKPDKSNTIQNSRKESRSEKTKGSYKDFGLSLSALSPEKRMRFRIPPSIQGVLVEAVAPWGTASIASVEQGDVLVEVGRKPVKTVAEAKALLSRASHSLPVKLYKARAGGSVVLLLEKKKR